jgi:hypothetical protein
MKLLSVARFHCRCHSRLVAPALAALVLMTLAACSGPAPVVMLTPGGQLLRGSTAMPTVGPVDFTASDGALTCSGELQPAIMSRIVSITSTCTDGHTGTGRVERDGPLSGSGWIQMNDGSYASFAYGAAAPGI